MGCTFVNRNVSVIFKARKKVYNLAAKVDLKHRYKGYPILYLLEKLNFMAHLYFLTLVIIYIFYTFLIIKLNVCVFFYLNG